MKRTEKDWVYKQLIAERNGNKLLPTDFYWDKGVMVFTESYHLRRGNCCNNGCKHCPYKK